MPESKSGALPLGYTPVSNDFLGRTSDKRNGVKVRCLTTWLRGKILFDFVFYSQAPGFGSPESKSGALPLGDTPIFSCKS